jgi:hypothetical protein
MTPPHDHAQAIRAIVELLATEGRGEQIGVRDGAFFVLAKRLTGIHPRPLAVRAAAYSRMAVHQIGAAVLPATSGEIEHLREQAGDGIVLLGYDDLHLIWLVHGLLIDLADAHDWNDHGTLLRPYATPVPEEDAEGLWAVGGLRYGVTVAYERRASQMIALAPSTEAYRLADRIDTQLRTLRRTRRTA